MNKIIYFLIAASILLGVAVVVSLTSSTVVEVEADCPVLGEFEGLTVESELEKDNVEIFELEPTNLSVNETLIEGLDSVTTSEACSVKAIGDRR